MRPRQSCNSISCRLRTGRLCQPKLFVANRSGTQKFSSVHAAFHDPFNQDRHLISRETDKAQGAAALAEWKTVAGYALRPLPYLRPVETSCRWTDSTATHFDE